MPEPTKLPSELELRLWKSAADGDRRAMAEFLRVHQDLIYRFCRSQLDSDQQALDATQETAVRLIQKLSGFNGQSKISTWVLGIAKNVCREQKRKNIRFQQLPTEAVPASLADDENVPRIDDESQVNLHETIERLSDRQREAVVLRFFESLPLADVARAMEVSVGTVKATLNQAIKNLKLKMKQLD